MVSHDQKTAVSTHTSHQQRGETTPRQRCVQLGARERDAVHCYHEKTKEQAAAGRYRKEAGTFCNMHQNRDGCSNFNLACKKYFRGDGRNKRPEDVKRQARDLVKWHLTGEAGSPGGRPWLHSWSRRKTAKGGSKCHKICSFTGIELCSATARSNYPYLVSDQSIGPPARHVRREQYRYPRCRLLLLIGGQARQNGLRVTKGQ